MAIQKRVYKSLRILPVRFTRCPTRQAGKYNPDIDDRGYSRYHGPVVGTCRNDNFRVRVLRDMLEAAAPLYIDSEDNSKVSVVSPAAGTVLPNGAHADIELRAGTTDGDCKVRVRAQRRDGPIVAELTVHVSSVINVRCAVHRTAIYNLPGARAAANTTTRTFADIDNVFAEVNHQWRPIGINFQVDTRRDNTNLTNQVARNGVNPSNGVLLCPVFGSGVANQNFTLLMGTNSVANRLNIYFVRSIQAAGVGGAAGPNYIGFGSAHHRGMVMSDNIGDLETTAHTLAHELGHILNLAGSGHTNRFDSHSDDDPQWNADVRRRRHDLWTRRRLMYYMVGLQADERTGTGNGQVNGRYPFDGMDVGYGNGRSGHMITIKSLTQDPTDDEYNDARTRAATL